MTTAVNKFGHSYQSVWEWVMRSYHPS